MNRAGEHEPESRSAAPLREHYIPLRPADLVEKLANEPAVTIFEREQFRQLCQLLQATIHHDYRSRLEELKAAYAPFDPDDDAAEQFPLEKHELAARCRRLFDRFDSLLMRANYRRLSREDLEQAIRAPNTAGPNLHLDLKLFERLEIYVRGRGEQTHSVRSWRTLWRARAEQVPIHRRLAIIYRLAQRTPLTEPQGTREVVLKLFKNIPEQDVETLLPGASIKIGWLEQAQIALPTLSGIGLTLFKLLKGAAAVAFAGIYGMLAFLGLIGGAIGYGVRSFYSYLRTREKHQLSLTRHLYFQNLDNNAGVIYHLLAEAEEQEFREIVLAWWLLWRGGLAGASAPQIDVAAEAWLRERCGIDADFEIGDALAKLARLGLAQVPASGRREPRDIAAHLTARRSRETQGHRESDASRSPARWQAVSIEAALETLDRAWDEQFDYHRPRTQRIDATPQAHPRIWRRAA
ncbi:MAG TPA: DUF3754 domain-containing protein [Pirellulaceae bacterium]|nr:DUF3754 domain-containing protein [Pirellulaceae bacterium]